MFSRRVKYPLQITSADRSVAAPGAVLEAQSSSKSIQLEIAVALVKRSCSIVRRIRCQRVTSVLNVFGFTAINICRKNILYLFHSFDIKIANRCHDIPAVLFLKKENNARSFNKSKILWTD